MITIMIVVVRRFPDKGRYHNPDTLIKERVARAGRAGEAPPHAHLRDPDQVSGQGSG